MRVRRLQCLMMLALVGSMAALAQVQEQQPQAQAQNCLVKAQTHYRNMRLKEAIRVLDDCQDQGWQGLDNSSQKTAALRLLAISYFTRGDSTLAQTSVIALLEVDGRYRSDPNIDPVFFETWVHELRPRAWHQKWWVRAAGGALISGVAGCWAAGCFTSKPKDLPGPGGSGFFPGSN